MHSNEATPVLAGITNTWLMQADPVPLHPDLFGNSLITPSATLQHGSTSDHLLSPIAFPAGPDANLSQESFQNLLAPFLPPGWPMQDGAAFLYHTADSHPAQFMCNPVISEAPALPSTNPTNWIFQSDSTAAVPQPSLSAVQSPPPTLTPLFQSPQHTLTMPVSNPVNIDVSTHTVANDTQRAPRPTRERKRPRRPDESPPRQEPQPLPEPTRKAKKQPRKRQAGKENTVSPVNGGGEVPRKRARRD